MINVFMNNMTKKSIYAGVRGENFGGPNPLQKVLRNELGETSVIATTQAMRSALRETMDVITKRDKHKVSVNRERVQGELLAVKYRNATPDVMFDKKTKNETPIHDSDRFVDDCVLGYLEIETGLYEQRDSVLRINNATSISPFNSDDVTYHQSPTPKHLKDKNVQLYQDECIYTAFQYPLAFNVDSITGKHKNEMIRVLLKSINELGHVGGNQARYYYEFAPVNSIIVMSDRCVGSIPDFIDENDYLSIVNAINSGCIVGNVILAGPLFENIPEDIKSTLPNDSVKIFGNVEDAMDSVSYILTGDVLYGRK